MNQKLFHLFVIFVVALGLTSCSGLPRSSGTGGGGNATLSLTMIDPPPANSSVLSFKVTITGIALNPATGSPVSLLSSSNSLTVELTRLQSDSAFLGTFKTVPAGTYNSMTVTLANPDIVLANQTGAALTGATAACPTNSVCEFKPTPTGGAVQITFTPALSLTSTTPQGLSLDFNLNNAITFTSTTGTLGVDFSQTNQPNFLTTSILPRTNSNLSTGQLELIEDFTGVVTSATASTNTLTVQSATRGTLTVVANSSTIFDRDPSGTLCTSPSFSSCVLQNETASIDAVLNADGTFTLLEFEPLVSATTGPEDLIEGVVYFVSPTIPAQFQLVVTDKEQGSTTELAGLNTGDQVLIKIGTTPTLPTFLVDTKHLSSGTGFPTAQTTAFKSATDNSVLAAGQVVSVHVPASSFTPASGTTIASATVNSVMLRWSHITGTVSSPAPPNTFNLTPAAAFIPQGVPPNTGIAFGTTTPPVQTFSGITNFDGFASNFPATGDSVTVRALFFRSPSFVFTAAKVRKH